MTNFDALGLFDGILVLHYDDDRKEVYDRLIKDNKYNVYTLTNSESIVVIDNNIIFVKEK